MLKCRKRAWYINNKASVLERKRILFQEARKGFINELGGKCVLCGEDDIYVLDFDHIYNDGCITRAKNQVHHFKKHGLDKTKIQLLCKNCNWRKERIRRQKAAYKEPVTTET